MGEVCGPGAVELPDDEHVALPQGAQAAVESRPVVADAGGEVVAGCATFRAQTPKRRISPPPANNPLVTVRRGKTNQEGETRDVRFVKGGVAAAVRTLRAAARPAPEDRVVPLSPKMVGLRFQAAARAAGVERVTAHSGRVGLASELTSRGASTTDVMLAGNWKTSRMVAHYSAGATAERGAVARYL